MKNSIIYSLVLMLLLLSCNTNDDENINEPNPLVGTWNLVAESSSSTMLIEKEGMPIDTLRYSLVGKDFNFKVTFLENPNQIITEGYYNEILTKKEPHQNRITELRTVHADDKHFGESWSLNGNTLNIKFNEDKFMIGEISLLDENTIIFNYSMEDRNEDWKEKERFLSKTLYSFTIQRQLTN